VTISALSFSPTANYLAWTDIEGTLTRWSDPIPSTHPHPSKQAGASSTSKGTSSKPTGLSSKELDEMFGENLGDDAVDAMEEMALDAQGYQDDWIDDDVDVLDDDLGAGAGYLTADGLERSRNVGLEGDEGGLREMGMSLPSGYPSNSYVSF
jgi:chromosome transmission fidelity protein 4